MPYLVWPVPAVVSTSPTAGCQPARHGCAKCQAPYELRNRWGDPGDHRAEHAYEDGKDRGRQQLGIAAPPEGEKPKQRVQRSDHRQVDPENTRDDPVEPIDSVKTVRHGKDDDREQEG